MARYNCIALSVYVCRTSTPRELEMFWRRQECHSEMIPQGLALHSSQLTSSQGKGSLSACSNLRAPPPTATRSFTFYLHRRADWFISEGGRREIRCNPNFCFFRGPKSGGVGWGSHREGSGAWGARSAWHDDPPLSFCTSTQAEVPREPQKAGSINPIALAELGAVQEAPTERSAQEITAPFRPRLSRCGRSIGAPSVWKNSQTRPHAASDCSSEPPRRTLVLGPAEMCAVATAGTQAEGVRRGLRTEICRLFCSPQRKRPGRQADCLRSKSVLQVCAPGNCAGSRPATSSGAVAYSRASGVRPARDTLSN